MGSLSKRDREFAEFFEAHFASACRYARALCGDSSEGEELAQHAFVRMYARWPKVRAESADAYLRTTVTRLFLDTKRRGRARERPVDEVPETPVHPRQPIVERQPLQTALLGLPPRQRAVLLLRFGYDLPIDEVAVALDCSAGTVKSQASRGLATLRERYEEQNNDLPDQAPGKEDRWPTTTTFTRGCVN